MSFASSTAGFALPLERRLRTSSSCGTGRLASVPRRGGWGSLVSLWYFTPILGASLISLLEATKLTDLATENNMRTLPSCEFLVENSKRCKVTGCCDRYPRREVTISAAYPLPSTVSPLPAIKVYLPTQPSHPPLFLNPDSS